MKWTCHLFYIAIITSILFNHYIEQRKLGMMQQKALNLISVQDDAIFDAMRAISANDTLAISDFIKSRKKVEQAWLELYKSAKE